MLAAMGWLADDDMGGFLSFPLPRTPSTRPQNEYRDIIFDPCVCFFLSLGSETLLVESRGRDIFSTAASGTKSEKWKNRGFTDWGHEARRRSNLEN